MSALAFALVDAVLCEVECRPLNHNTWEQARSRIGWWRSLWPLGGGM